MRGFDNKPWRALCVAPFGPKKQIWVVFRPQLLRAIYRRQRAVHLDPSEVSKAIGRGGFNIRLAGQLTGYEIDVYREGMEEDVELTEFSDEIEAWIIEEFKKVGLDTAKSVLEQDVEDLVKRTDLEEETIQDVRNILSAEFSNE